MTTITIESIDVEFAYVPYPEQIEMMRAILSTVSPSEGDVEGKPKIAIIESPTGTGKTLSSLCPLVSLQMSQRHGYDQPKNSRECRPRGWQPIVFASRTHAQLDSAMGQLKAWRDKSSNQDLFTLPFIMLGSKDKTCQNKELAGWNGILKNRKCLDLRLRKTCRYRDATKYDLKGPMAIEDLGSKKLCPYYSAHNNLNEAGIIMCPYYYLGSLPEAIMKNAIVIIDECHNLPGWCEDSLSAKCVLQDLIDLGNSLDGETKNLLDITLSFLNAIESNSIDVCGTQAYQFLNSPAVMESAHIVMGSADSIEKSGILTPSVMDAFTRLQSFYRLITSPEFTKNNAEKFVLTINEKEGSLTLHCLCPSVKFKSLVERCSSMVLMSATIDPDQFKADLLSPLSLDFHKVLSVGLSAPRLNIAKIISGHGNKLNGSLRSRQENGDAYYDEIGLNVLKVIETMPNGGAIIFFTSNQLKLLFLARWTEKGIAGDLVNLGYDIFLDLGGYQDAIRTSKRGLLLAVFNSALSEGINFADEYSRVVIAVGLPYANSGNVKVQAKRAFLNRTRGSLQAAQWYENNAIQVVNQSIGRCIRHRGDYGAIIFIDSRYQSKKTKLSSWLKFHTGDISSSMKSFWDARSGFELPHGDPPLGRPQLDIADIDSVINDSDEREQNKGGMRYKVLRFKGKDGGIYFRLVKMVGKMPRGRGSFALGDLKAKNIASRRFNDDSFNDECIAEMKRNYKNKKM